MDILIELNQEKISKIKSLATQKYEFIYKAYPKSAIGKRLKFIKGKQPKFVSKEDGLPYLVIDDLDGKATNFFDFCLNQICNLRTQISLLNFQKEILLQKYFH